jgi:hypothetical protein
MIRIKKHEFHNRINYINNEIANGIYINDDGDIFWYKEGKLHRDDDKPAIMCNNNYKAWYKDGLLHRDGDQPAVLYGDGDKEWYRNGLIP